jgi:hypothetical protein
MMVQSSARLLMEIAATSLAFQFGMAKPALLDREHA